MNEENEFYFSPNDEIVQKIEEVTGYSNRRRNKYTQLEEQLGMLFKDIENGLFGDNPKNGLFYNHILNIKNDEPKPENLDILKQELDELIIQENKNIS